MPEPTIEEMLQWLDSEVDSFSTRDNYAEYMRAIRALLEQHRIAEQDDADLERYAINAFVERVIKQWQGTGAYSDKYSQMLNDALVKAELAATTANKEEK